MKITRLPQHNVSTNEAVLITKICYGINGTAIELNGERDRNFLIINPDGKKFILKISNPADSQEIIDFHRFSDFTSIQTEVMKIIEENND